MKVALNTARRFLERDGFQISTEAAVLFAFTLEEEGKAIADRTLALLQEENHSRELQGLPPRVRITAEDVRRALPLPRPTS